MSKHRGYVFYSSTTCKRAASFESCNNVCYVHARVYTCVRSCQLRHVNGPSAPHTPISQRRAAYRYRLGFDPCEIGAVAQEPRGESARRRRGTRLLTRHDVLCSLPFSVAHAARLRRTKRSELRRSIFRGVDLDWNRGAWLEGG